MTLIYNPRGFPGQRMGNATRARITITVSHQLTVQTDRETDGRWIAEVGALPGVMAYGATRAQAVAKVRNLAARVVAERLRR